MRRTKKIIKRNAVPASRFAVHSVFPVVQDSLHYLRPCPADKNSSLFSRNTSNLPYAHKANLLREHQMLRAQGSLTEEYIEIGNS
jgi:hypothetical protein